MKSNLVNKEILDAAIKAIFDSDTFILVTGDKYFQVGTDKVTEGNLINACVNNKGLIDILNEATKESELAMMKIRNEKGL